jgi:phage tail-like protein
VRGTIAGASTPHPLGATLPAVYAGDDFTQRLCAALDVVLAPVPLTLDSLPAYFDPDTTPEDMLGWLAHWVALPAEESQGPAEQRRRIRAASELHAARGTVAGLRSALTLALGPAVAVDVDEGGASTWSASAGAALPGSGEPVLLVRLHGPGADEAARARADGVIALIKPAHVPHRTELRPD